MKSSLSLVKHALICLHESSLDTLAYFKSAFTTRFHKDHGNAQLESLIVRLSHVVEKGLTMPDFKPRSGKQTVGQLARLIADPAIPQKVGIETIMVAKAVMDAYVRKHEELEIDISDLFTWKALDPEECLKGGVRPWTPVTDEDARAFFRVASSRASIRAFEPGKIPDSSIVERCIQNAMQSPSVCNRQTWRTHLFQGEQIAPLLALQNGNRGFGHTVPILILVTVDMRFFCGAEERFQPWIEGGIFSMALMLALHASGLASVPLNWSVKNSTDRKMREISDIPDHERSIMFIGCGYPQDSSTAAKSARRLASEIMRWH